MREDVEKSGGGFPFLTCSNSYVTLSLFKVNFIQSLSYNFHDFMQLIKKDELKIQQQNKI